MSPETPDSRPFEDVRILDFSRVVSAPYATMLLHLLGAEVIKVESPDGDGTRGGRNDSMPTDAGLGPVFIAFNAGKKSLTLDLKKPEAIEIVKKLVRTADVVMENFRPGVMDRLGIGYDALRAENPKIVYCAVTGFGQTGPESKSPAYDGKMQAMSGMMSVSGRPDDDPMRAGYTVADTASGLNAALAISAALYQRKSTGRSQFIDVAMLDSAMQLMAQATAPYLNGGAEPARTGNLSVTGEPVADCYRTADDRLMFSVVNTVQIENLMRAIGREDLVGDPRLATRQSRMENGDFIHAAVQAKLLKAPASEWAGKLNRAGAPCGLVMSAVDALNQPQAQHRGQTMEFTDPATGVAMRTLGAGFTFAHGGPGTDLPPQRLGAQNETLLAEIGYGAAEIKALADGKII